MDKRLGCTDIGLACDYSVCARTDEEAIRKIGEHIQGVHAMKGFSKGFYDRALASIHEGSCEREWPLDEFLCEACSGTCLC